MPENASPERTLHEYECQVCGYRMDAESNPLTCPDCDGAMENVSTRTE